MALAAFLAAGLFSTQAPGAAGQAQQPGIDAAPGYQQQLVTVEGCLRRERAPEAAARQLAADPESNVLFVLAGVELRSRVDTVPGTAETAGDERPLGPAGLENERLGVPVDETSPQLRETREANERPDSPAVTGAPTPAAERYVVVGLDEDRLKPFAGQRVALAGQFEPSVASVTQRGVAAEDASRPSPAGTSGSDGWLPDLPRFRAASIKPVAGICAPKP